MREVLSNFLGLRHRSARKLSSKKKGGSLVGEQEVERWLERLLQVLVKEE